MRRPAAGLEPVARERAWLGACFPVAGGARFPSPDEMDPDPVAVRMSVTLFVPGVLRRYCEGRSQLELASRTVQSALDELERNYPALYRNVCDETGRVRQHVNVFVNRDHIRNLDGMQTPLSAGDSIIVLPAVSGG